MNTRLFTLPALFLVASTAACAVTEDDAAESSDKLAGNQSAWTPLGENQNCEVLSKSAEGDEAEYQESNCGGMGGYEVLVTDIDSRQLVTIRTPTGDYDLELASHLPAMGYLGPKAEWRGRVLGLNQVEPKALIFRYFQPTDQQANRSFLVVAKVTPDAACIYATVSGNMRDGNVNAQIEADKSDTITCAPKTPRPLPSKQCGVLTPGTGLGQDTALTSCEGKYSLVMQTDGNLVVYNNTKKKAIWQTHTVETDAKAAILRPDGSFSVYGPSQNALWTASAGGNPNAHLDLQDDGNLVLYSEKGKVLWASWTQGK